MPRAPLGAVALGTQEPGVQLGTGQQGEKRARGRRGCRARRKLLDGFIQRWGEREDGARAPKRRLGERSRTGEGQGEWLQRGAAMGAPELGPYLPLQQAGEAAALLLPLLLLPVVLMQEGPWMLMLPRARSPPQPSGMIPVPKGEPAPQPRHPSLPAGRSATAWRPPPARRGRSRERKEEKIPPLRSAQTWARLPL